MSDFLMKGLPATKTVSLADLQRSLKEKAKPELPFKIGDRCVFLGHEVYVSEEKEDGTLHLAWLDCDLRLQEKVMPKKQLVMLKKIDPKEEAKQEPKDPLKSFIQYTGTKWASITREELQSRLDGLWSYEAVQLPTQYNQGRCDVIKKLAKMFGIKLREE